MKKALIIFSLFGLIILLGCAFYFWLIINGSGNTKADKIDSCNYNKLLEFKGKISKVDNYNYNDYMFDKFLGITISGADSVEYNIQFDLIKYADLKTFIYKNQTVIKNKNSIFISIADTNNNIRTIIYPDCEVEN